MSRQARDAVVFEADFAPIWYFRHRFALLIARFCTLFFVFLAWPNSEREIVAVIR